MTSLIKLNDEKVRKRMKKTNKTKQQQSFWKAESVWFVPQLWFVSLLKELPQDRALHQELLSTRDLAPSTGIHSTIAKVASDILTVTSPWPGNTRCVGNS